MTDWTDTPPAPIVDASGAIFEPIVDECGACGDEVVEDEPHVCPVGGNVVTLRREDVIVSAHGSAKDEVVPGARWEFGDDVAEAFEDMLERSIPQYDVMRQAVFDVGSSFVQSETAVVDLGCSRGAALEPFVKRFGARCRYVGVEVSAPMVAAARERFAVYDGTKAWNGVSDLVQIRETDLRHGYPSELASLTLAVLTLQFTPIEYRPRILRKIREHTADGGAFVIVEKVLGDVAETDDLMVRLYHEHKRRAGYTDEQIVRKAASLEGVLVPLTARFDVELIRDAGFRTVECFWRWMNFAAWVAVP